MDFFKKNKDAIKAFLTFLFIILIIVSSIRGCINKGDKTRVYSLCSHMWQQSVKPERIDYYDQYTGDPIYKYPPMDRKFKSECKNKVNNWEKENDKELTHLKLMGYESGSDFLNDILREVKMNNLRR